ncbi:MAG: hypothetical protein IJA22_03805, partial [Clostridia bacterium]|nr:hypothetical protein [Clostridia bacterium]
MTIKRKTFFFAIVFTVAATLGVSMGVYAIVQALSLKFNMSVYLKPDIIFAMDLEVDATGDGVYENGPYCIFNNQDQTKMEAWATVSQNKIVLNRTVPGSEEFNPVQNLTSASVFKITVTNLTQNPTGETNVLAVGLDETAGFITTHELGVQNIHYGNSDTFAFNACLALAGGYYDIPLFANLSSAPVLTVYQEIDTTNKPTDWVKVGYNATLSATATKVETNSFDTLAEHLESKDVYGNVTSYAYGEDQYSLYAPIYKDIDIVNVDLETGEIIGKLSDTNYDFEWYGGSVTLPSGTTLPSGRTLTKQTPFANVDVYTYYPTMYMKRWVENNRQYISLADWEFEGSIKVDEFYTGTFEATTYNPDKTIATNSNGVIPRSYLYDWRPLTSTTITHQSTYYESSNFESSEAAKASTTQAQMLTWSSNLTKAWNDGEDDLESTYKKATGVQGENWTRYIYNNLYLIKYADNHSQDTVGYGNTYAGSAYNGKTITYPDGTSILLDEWAKYCTAAETGSGTIGVYDTSKA